jgi:hypothetical protein
MSEVAVKVTEDPAPQSPLELRVKELERLVSDFALGPRGVNGHGVYENDSVFAVRVKRESRKALGR